MVRRKNSCVFLGNGFIINNDSALLLRLFSPTRCQNCFQRALEHQNITLDEDLNDASKQVEVSSNGHCFFSALFSFFMLLLSFSNQIH